MNRVGEWMQLYPSGRQFWPLDPRPEEIDIHDIAHALSLQCRFAGHVRVHYSVAEHSVRVSRLCARQDSLWGLLHDASEAYLVDLPRPLKRASAIGTAYQEAEARLMAAICERFGLPVEEPASVREADSALLLAEARDLLKPPPVPWQEVQGAQSERLAHMAKTVETILPWRSIDVEEMFLARFRQLGGRS